MSICLKCQGFIVIDNRVNQRDNDIDLLRIEYADSIKKYAEYKSKYKQITSACSSDVEQIEDVYGVVYDGKCCEIEGAKA